MDLLIETDKAVVGVESKFYAQFQDNQPAKYRADVEQLARQLGIARNRPQMRAMIAVIAPLGRSDEVKEVLARQQLAGFATMYPWEGLLDALAGAEAGLKGQSGYDIQTELIVSELEQFIRPRLEFLLDIPDRIPHLFRHWEAKGNTEQSQFIYDLQSSELFPNAARVSPATQWIGCGFTPTPDDPFAGWFGFVQSDAILKGEHRPAEFIIMRRSDLSTSRAYFTPVELKNNIFAKPPNYVWKLAGSEHDWSAAETWRTRISELTKVA